MSSVNESTFHTNQIVQSIFDNQLIFILYENNCKHFIFRIMQFVKLWFISIHPSLKSIYEIMRCTYHFMVYFISTFQYFCFINHLSTHNFLPSCIPLDPTSFNTVSIYAISQKTIYSRRRTYSCVELYTKKTCNTSIHFLFSKH